MKQKSILSLMAITMLFSLTLHAEEGGSGHYMPGAMASFADAFIGEPGKFAVVPSFTMYDGDASASEQIPTIGAVAMGLDAEVYAASVSAVYQTSIELLGGHYAFGGALSYVSVDTTGSLSINGVPGGKVSESADGFGDLVLIPAMLGWVEGDLKYDIRLVVYAPTGDYDKDSLANVGKNYWTFSPTIALSYLSAKTGLEAGAFAGVDFNTENDDTDYKTGAQFHLDVTAAQHLPLGKGVAGIGANAFYYQQISGDSGAGASLGDFKGRTAGVGPVLSYVTKIGGADVVTELKWLPELDSKRRLEGDYIWLKVATVF